MGMTATGPARIPRLVRAALAVLACAFAAAGCSDAPDRDLPPPSPLIYELASADGGVEGWMLGTIHALPAGTDWQSAPIRQAIAEADYLIVEIASLDDDSALSGLFTQLGSSPGHPPLAERVPARLRPDLARLLERGDLPPERFSTIESWAAALMLAQIDADGAPEHGVDRRLIRAFAGRAVRELEGARTQLGIFDALPEAEQRDLLAGVIAEKKRLRDDPGGLRRAWLAGDVAALEKLIDSGIMADPELQEALLLARNRRWAERLSQVLEQPERPLVAVGAAHLVGPGGLAELLEARGFTVTRLR